MIEIKDVNMKYPLDKGYKDTFLRPFKKELITALKDINININDGDNVAFLGENGAGKTTLLKLVAGILYPTNGKISVNNFDTVKHNLLARKSVGYVLNEERSFYWRLTGIQNLDFFGHLDNIFGKELKNKIDELISLVGLENAANKRFATYSSGMKQRLAIARGLLSDPNILVLDEPTRTLDPIAAEEIRGLITKKVHAYFNKTILIATHSLVEAEKICNKVCILSKSKLLLYQTKSDILDKYESLEQCYKTTINLIQ